MPAINDPAVVEGRTKFPNTVVPVEGRRVLKDGSNSCKTGNRIIKGDWHGFRIHTLSLEERSTCPVICEHWRSCFGNNTPFAERLKHGADLERAVEHEVAELSAKHGDGFAVRLHVLGDFYSPEYVKTWHRLFDRHRQLHAFGFSRRWGSDDPIDLALAKLKAAHPKRFRMRWSSRPGKDGTTSIETPRQCPPGYVVCPAQTDTTGLRNCGNCGLCFNSDVPVAFLRH